MDSRSILVFIIVTGSVAFIWNITAPVLFEGEIYDIAMDAFPDGSEEEAVVDWIVKCVKLGLLGCVLASAGYALAANLRREPETYYR